MCVCVTHLLANAVLVDGPDGWHVGGQQLILCEGGIAGPGADQPGFAYCIIPDHHTLDSFHIGTFIVRVYIHGEGPGGEKGHGLVQHSKGEKKVNTTGFKAGGLDGVFCLVLKATMAALTSEDDGAAAKLFGGTHGPQAERGRVISVTAAESGRQKRNFPCLFSFLFPLASPCYVQMLLLRPSRFFCVPATFRPL